MINQIPNNKTSLPSPWDVFEINNWKNIGRWEFRRSFEFRIIFFWFRPAAYWLNKKTNKNYVARNNTCFCVTKKLFFILVQHVSVTALELDVREVDSRSKTVDLKQNLRSAIKGRFLAVYIVFPECGILSTVLNRFYLLRGTLKRLYNIYHGNAFFDDTQSNAHTDRHLLTSSVKKPFFRAVLFKKKKKK